METGIGHKISASIIKILFILLIIFQISNLVICGDPDDDSLQNALEFVERRQRDLQLQDEYYGQPEDIGYGYQKNFGIFEDGPARELGSPDSDPENENDFANILYNYGNYRKYNDFDSNYNKRKSSFRERHSNIDSLVNEREINGNGWDDRSDHYSYMDLLKDLWLKYRQSHPEDSDIEDLTTDQVFEILNNLNKYDLPKASTNEESYENSGENDESYYDTIPLRNRRNYRVFDRLADKEKRYSSFGEGLYGKRSARSQHINYENPSQDDFLYALKFVNPYMNQEAVENLKETGYDFFGDEKDKDVLRILNDAIDTPRPNQPEPWERKDEPLEEEEEEVWGSESVAYPSDGTYQRMYDANSDKRMEPKIFKAHNGIHLNRKRLSVKQNFVRSKKEVTDDKVTKELKKIFENHQEVTTIPPKKESTKKPVEAIKKQNITKPEVTKHRDVKKLVRRANDFTKEQIYPINNDIEKIFNGKKVVNKKSIDWSQYFGYDKRSQQWLLKDSIKKAEDHILAPKNERYFPQEKKDSNFFVKSQYQIPFNTRIFNNKERLSHNDDSNIDKMEEKLGNIEGKIIDDTVKYTGAHVGNGKEDLRRVKNEIMHHLEAAYSLEKMKNALEEFKNSMKSEKSSPDVEEPESLNTESSQSKIYSTTVRVKNPIAERPMIEKIKRVSTKKGIDDVYKKDQLEFLNWPSQKDREFLKSQYVNSEGCPILDKSLNNCLRVDGISGRFAELLLPICSLQQICYLCGSEIGWSKPSVCDMMYLTEAEKLCQGNKSCLLNARNSMLTLRDLHEQELMNGNSSQASGSCFFNRCIQKYFMNTQPAMVSLEYQD